MSVTVVFCDPSNVQTRRVLLHNRFIGATRAFYTTAHFREALQPSIESAYQPHEWLGQGMHFDIVYGAESIPFMAMGLHVDCGGLCVGLRNGRTYSVFDSRGAPDFDWMWQDVNFHILHSVEILAWDESTEILARIRRDRESLSRPIKA